MELFADLDRIIQGYLPADKIELIKRAFVIARDAHEGQFRSSGEPYITHPVAVVHYCSTTLRSRSGNGCAFARCY